MLPNTVDIQLTRNPFESGRVHSYAFEGETIEHMIVSRGLRLDAAHGILVSVGGELVPERMFSRVKPKAGVSVIIKVIPRGGQKGKAILQIVIGVLALAASIITFLRDVICRVFLYYPSIGCLHSRLFIYNYLNRSAFRFRFLSFFIFPLRFS